MELKNFLLKLHHGGRIDRHRKKERKKERKKSEREKERKKKEEIVKGKKKERGEARRRR